MKFPIKLVSKVRPEGTVGVSQVRGESICKGPEVRKHVTYLETCTEFDRREDEAGNVTKNK